MANNFQLKWFFSLHDPACGAYRICEILNQDDLLFWESWFLHRNDILNKDLAIRLDTLRRWRLIYFDVSYDSVSNESEIPDSVVISCGSLYFNSLGQISYVKNV